MNSRTLLIGIDGATFRLILPYVKDGSLKNIGRLMADGCWGDLTSTIPPITSPAWPALMTGKLPGKLGVFGFHEFKPQYILDNFINSTHIPSKMFWEIAGDCGKKVFIVNFPFTYPIRKASGGIISGFLTPENATDFYYPPSLSSDVKDYSLAYPEDLKEAGGLQGFMARMEEGLSKRCAVMERMAAKDKYDLFMFCFQEFDLSSHFMWKYIDPGFSEYNTDDGAAARAYMKRIHVKFDETIGKILELQIPDNVMIASDHGSGPVGKYFFNINRLFIEHGILKSNRRSIHRMIFRNLPKSLRKGFEERWKDKIALVDFSRTSAWCSSYRTKIVNIMINLKGKYPGGIISPGKEYEELLDKITGLLMNVRHNGKQVVREVWRKEELYNGDYLDIAPDLTLRIDDDYEVPHNMGDSVRWPLFGPDPMRERRSGGHEQQGIFIISGKGIKKGGKVKEEGIQSIAPTALFLLGLPVPKDMDGRVMEQAMEEGILESWPVRYSEPSRYEGNNPSAGYEDEKLVEEQLRALGYI